MELQDSVKRETLLIPLFIYRPLLNSLFAAEPPSPDFIISGILPLEVGVCSATGGMGKTTIMLWLALHLITGREIFGHRVERPGGVLFVTGEDNLAIFRYRAYQLGTQLGLTADERLLVEENLYIEDASTTVVRLVEADAKGNLVPTDVVDRLTAAYRGRNISLVVLDPLISFSPGERFVNDGAQMLVTQARKLMVGLGAAVQFISHVSKVHAQTQEPKQHATRGGTAIGDACRYEYEIATMKDKDLRTLPPEVLEDGAVGYNLYVHKLSHALRPDLPYQFVRSGWKITPIAPDEASDAEKETRKVEANTKRTADDLAKVVTYMGTLDLTTNPTSARALRDVKDHIGLSQSALAAAITYGLQRRVLEERELPEAQKKGAKKHGLYVVRKKHHG